MCSEKGALGGHTLPQIHMEPYAVSSPMKVEKVCPLWGGNVSLGEESIPHGTLVYSSKVCLLLGRSRAKDPRISVACRRPS